MAKMDVNDLFGTFLKGLAILVAIWLIGLLAGMLGYAAPSVDAMYLAGTTGDWIGLLVQAVGTIILVIALDGIINPVKKQIFKK